MSQGAKPLTKIDLRGTFNSDEMEQEEIAPSLGALLDAVDKKGVEQILLASCWMNISCS